MIWVLFGILGVIIVLTLFFEVRRKRQRKSYQHEQKSLQEIYREQGASTKASDPEHSKYF